MDKEGEIILRDIGIKKEQQILDFGCGTGVYTVFASRIVGSSGKIYALDSDEEGLLRDLISKIEKEKIKNIEIIKTSGKIEFPLSDESMDVVLIYDVLHLLDNDERNKLFMEASRVLIKGGFVSYHATHREGKERFNLEDIHNKMKANGLYLNKEFKRPMFHWAWIEDSLIFNYLKKQ
jgi:ubiquinone/menaquinone biosynthesis C-methylase UbiE